MEIETGENITVFELDSISTYLNIDSGYLIHVFMDITANFVVIDEHPSFLELKQKLVVNGKIR